MSARKGYRGYIGSRRYFGDRAPQHVQNLVIRDYCQRNKFNYLLSATEYAMDNCFMILEDVVREASQLDGIVMYSIFMLPPDAARRRDVIARIFAAGAGLHGAVESLAIADDQGRMRLEEVWNLRLVQAATWP